MHVENVINTFRKKKYHKKEKFDKATIKIGITLNTKFCSFLNSDLLLPNKICLRSSLS